MAMVGLSLDNECGRRLGTTLGASDRMSEGAPEGRKEIVTPSGGTTLSFWDDGGRGDDGGEDVMETGAVGRGISA